MKYGSVCSGIEAASVAWEPLGWEAQWFSEIEPFPSAVLAHRFPNVPNLGDMTLIHEKEEFNNGTIDLLVGGTPCQSFSVAGLRKGLDDARGNLMLTFVELAARKRPRWVVWENVPGVLSSKGGRDFASFLGLLTGREVHPPAGGWQNSGMLSGIGSAYGVAWCVRDAQYFGVAQRRRRVFVVGYLGDWRPAAAVLFERHSLSGHPAPRREKREGASAGIETSFGGGKFTDIAATLDTGCKDGPTRNQAGMGIMQKWPAETASTLNAAFGDKQGYEYQHALNGAPLFVPQPIPINTMTMLGRPSDDLNPRMGSDIGNPGDPCPTLTKAHSHAVAHTFKVRGGCEGGGKGYLGQDEAAFTISTGQDQSLAHGTAIRRVTPVETERLQGFPDHWTRIPSRNKPADQCPDGPRYKACGNSMAVPVMRWIGERIGLVENIINHKS